MGLLRHLPVIGCVVSAHGVDLAEFLEAFPAVLPQRLELGESGGASGVGCDDEGFVDQSADDIEDLAGWDLVVGADRLGGCQLTAAGKHRKPGEQVAFVVEQQVVAPVHHCPQGLVAG